MPLSHTATGGRSAPPRTVGIEKVGCALQGEGAPQATGPGDGECRGMRNGTRRKGGRDPQREKTGFGNNGKLRRGRVCGGQEVMKSGISNTKSSISNTRIIEEYASRDRDKGETAPYATERRWEHHTSHMNYKEQCAQVARRQEGDDIDEIVTPHTQGSKRGTSTIGPENEGKGITTVIREPRTRGREKGVQQQGQGRVVSVHDDNRTSS
ncbi:hypothetical protein BJY52DRAFT_1228664 [Lactarius psammicola]|nr:hypothetical protein BJY52DRAFT_1228664 [Lactarius psammicola]